MGHRKSYCSDGFCGALDCYRCHGDDYLCDNCGRVADCECEQCEHCDGYVEGEEHLVYKGDDDDSRLLRPALQQLRRVIIVRWLPDFEISEVTTHLGHEKQCDCFRCGECGQSCEYDCKCPRCEDCGERRARCDCEDRSEMRADVKKEGVCPRGDSGATGGSESIEAANE